MYNAKRKNGGEPVSVFVFDKKTLLNYIAESGMNKKVAEDVYIRLRREVNSLSKLRHPSIVKVIEPLEESKAEISFVTEPLIGCLKSVIDLHTRNPSDDDSDWNDLVIQRGLLQVTEGLMFLHNHVGYVHLDIQPTSIVIDSKGDWKLSGMGFATNFQESKQEYFIDQFDPRLPQFVQLNLDYAAPELVLDHKLDPTNDIFSLGCLILTIYCSKPPLSTKNIVSTYKNELPTITRQLRNPRIPSHLSSVIPRLLARAPLERIDLQSLKQSEYFDNQLVRTINFLDEFPGKLVSEKKVFLQGIYSILNQFPKSVLQRKVLTSLLDELGKEEAIDYLLLKNILTIGKDMSQLGFSERILPALVKVKAEQGCQAAVIDFMDVLLSRTSQDDFKKQILPIWVMILINAEPDRQKDLLVKLEPVVEKLDFVALKNDIFPPVGEVFGKTTSMSVKLECLKAFGIFIKHDLDKFVIKEKMIPLLSNMKTRDPHIIMTALDVYYAFINILDVEDLAISIVPHILALSMESSLTVNQFQLLFERVRTILDKVEQDKIKRLARNVPQTMTPRPSSTTPPQNAPKPQALDFNSLISATPTGSQAGSSLKLEPTSKTLSILDLDELMSKTSSADPLSSPPLSSPGFGATPRTSNSFTSTPSFNSQPATLASLQSQSAARPSHQSLNSFSTLSPQSATTSSFTSTASANVWATKNDDFGNFQTTPAIPRLAGPTSFQSQPQHQAPKQQTKGLDLYQSLL